jgi:hypothetical protein
MGCRKRLKSFRGLMSTPSMTKNRDYRRFLKTFAFTSLILMCGGLLLSACDQVDTTPLKSEQEKRREAMGGTVFGNDGLFGGPSGPQNDGSGLGVNAFLWRASLDTVSVWPVTSADPYGGVIITDWYAPPQTPNERFKLNVYIIDRALRADGVRVAVFRQVRGGGDWQDATVQAETATKLEDAILMRARQMRNQTASGQ